jgi:hypothetical protein
MDNRLPWDVAATDAADERLAAAGAAQIARRLIVVSLLTAATLDLTRCGLVILADLASACGSCGQCGRGQRWAGWAALLIGGASTPQAAASGFRGAYTIPDTATATIGLLLAITILMTAGRNDRRPTTPGIPACWTGQPRDR